MNWVHFSLQKIDGNFFAVPQFFRLFEDFFCHKCLQSFSKQPRIFILLFTFFRPLSTCGFQDFVLHKSLSGMDISTNLKGKMMWLQLFVCILQYFFSKHKLVRVTISLKKLSTSSYDLVLKLICLYIYVCHFLHHQYQGTFLSIYANYS